MPRCDDKSFCHSKINNKTLHHLIDYENNQKKRQNAKTQQKSETKCQSHLNQNHKLFSEKVFNEPLNVFSKLMGTINIRIM